MVAVKISKRCRLFFFGACIGLVWYCFFFRVNLALVRIDVVPDIRFSESVYGDIIDVVHKGNIRQLPDIASDILQVCFFVDSVELRYEIDGVLTVIPTMHEPLALINNSHVLCSHGQLFAKSIFADTYINNLPLVTVLLNDFEVDSELIVLCKDIVPLFIDIYNIEYKSKYDILLHS